MKRWIFLFGKHLFIKIHFMIINFLLAHFHRMSLEYSPKLRRLARKKLWAKKLRYRLQHITESRSRMFTSCFQASCTTRSSQIFYCDIFPHIMLAISAVQSD